MVEEEEGEVAKVAKVAGGTNWDHILFDDPAERAAIMEFDGGLSREEAERRAGLN